MWMVFVCVYWQVDQWFKMTLPPEDTQFYCKYDPKQRDLVEGVSKCMISGQEAQAKFSEYHETQGSHRWLQNKQESRGNGGHQPHFQIGETTCHQLSKRLPDNSTIFAAEATAISLALNYYQHMGPVHHDVVVVFAGKWGWRHWEPFYFPYHAPPLVEWQGHTCSVLLDTKPLWHWRKWKGQVDQLAKETTI